MSNLPVPAGDGGGPLPAILDRAGPGARFAADEFFRAQLGNPHTRAAYSRWVLRFLAWCEDRHVELARITPGIAAGFIGELAPATANQRLALAALRRFFDLLVTRHAVLLNPFQSVRGPPRSTHDGKTPEITPGQARCLLDSLDLSRLAGVRDRALFGTLATPAPASAPSPTSGSGTSATWAASAPSGSARSAAANARSPCATIWANGSPPTWRPTDAAGDPGDAPFFRPLTSGRTAFEPRPLHPWTIRAILKRRLQAAGLPDIITPHSFRAMVVTDLLSQGVSTEHVQYLVGHARPSTTQLYDRRGKTVTRNIVERISV